MTDYTKLSKEELLRKKQGFERLLAAKKARDSLLDFVRFTMPDPNFPDDVNKTLYSAQSLHRVIAEALEKVESGKMLAEGKRILCLSVGPQRGKTELASRRFIAWAMGKRPTRNLIFATYNDTFANETGDDVRSIMSTPQYGQVFPMTRLRKGSKSRDHQVTEHGGKMSFAGRGSAIAGRPADLVVIDDPLKNSEEAESLTIRNSTWNWFTRVMSTRCHAYSCMAIISTRWSEDDLIGRLTDPSNPCYDEEMAKTVLYINLPAYVEDPELANALEIPVGGSLWEERFPLEMLKLRQRLDPMGFSALEMGRPTPPEGAFYKTVQIRACGYKSMKDIPRSLRYYGSGDLAVSDERTADSSVVGDWGLDEYDVLWLMPNLYWGKKKADATVDEIIRMGKDHWMTLFGEKGQIDRAIRPFLEKRMQEENAYFNIETFPNVNKGQASLSFRGRVAQRKVRFPVFAEWWQKAEEQMLKFTGSGDDREDDFCDMCARIGQGLQMQVTASRTKLPSNVVEIKPGSIAWAHQQFTRQRSTEKRKKALMGM